MCVPADLKTGKSTVLASGRDFYSAPRISEDGSQVPSLLSIGFDHKSSSSNVRIIIAVQYAPGVDDHRREFCAVLLSLQVCVLSLYVHVLLYQKRGHALHYTSTVACLLI